MAPYANRPRVSGFRIQGSEFRVYDLGFRGYGLLWLCLEAAQRAGDFVHVLSLGDFLPVCHCDARLPVQPHLVSAQILRLYVGLVKARCGEGRSQVDAGRFVFRVSCFVFYVLCFVFCILMLLVFRVV